MRKKSSFSNHFFRFDLDFWEWVIEIEWYSYWYAMFPSMFASIGVVILSIISIKGAVDVSFQLLITFAMDLDLIK